MFRGGLFPRWIRKQNLHAKQPRRPKVGSISRPATGKRCRRQGEQEALWIGNAALRCLAARAVLAHRRWMWRRAMEYARVLQEMECYEASNRAAFGALTLDPRRYGCYGLIGRNMVTRMVSASPGIIATVAETTSSGSALLSHNRLWRYPKAI